MIAAKCTDAQVQAALRWASAEALAEYKQINAEVYGGWILSAEKQKLTGLHTAGLARMPPVTDEVLIHQTIHNSRSEWTSWTQPLPTETWGPRPWSKLSTGATSHPRSSHEPIGAHRQRSGTIWGR